MYKICTQNPTPHLSYAPDIMSVWSLVLENIISLVPMFRGLEPWRRTKTLEKLIEATICEISDQKAGSHVTLYRLEK